MHKLTLKKAEGYIKNRKVVISLEWCAERYWWVRYSWLGEDSKLFIFFYFANRYFNKLVRKYNLDVEWFADEGVTK